MRVARGKKVVEFKSLAGLRVLSCCALPCGGVAGSALGAEKAISIRRSPQQYVLVCWLVARVLVFK
jgi:hypothetical protein